MMPTVEELLSGGDRHVLNNIVFVLIKIVLKHCEKGGQTAGGREVSIVSDTMAELTEGRVRVWVAYTGVLQQCR